MCTQYCVDSLRLGAFQIAGKHAFACASECAFYDVAAAWDGARFDACTARVPLRGSTQLRFFTLVRGARKI